MPTSVGRGAPAAAPGRPSPIPAVRRPPPPSAPLPQTTTQLAPARALSRALVNSPRANGTRWWMQFRSPTAARSSLAPQAASSSEAAAPAPGQPGPSCPALGASRGGRPGTPPAGRVEEEEEEEEDVDQVPLPYTKHLAALPSLLFKGEEKRAGESHGGLRSPGISFAIWFLLASADSLAGRLQSRLQQPR